MTGFVFRTAFVAALLAIAGCAGQKVAENSQHLTKLVLSDDGMSELRMPESWVTRPDIVKDATIRVAGEGSDPLLVVNTYVRPELKTVSPADFAKAQAGRLSRALANGHASEVRTLKIGGRPAYEYVISGSAEGADLTYVSTAVDGERGIHNLIGWTVSAAYTGKTHLLHRVIATFSESAKLREAKQRVVLTFDWPEQLDFTTRFHGKAKKRTGSYELTGVYRSAVRPSGENHLQVQTRVLRQEYTSGNAAQADFMQKVLDQIRAEVPDYLITREGAFARVQDLAGFQKRVEDAVFQGLPTGASGKRSELLQKLKAGLSEQFLAAAVMDEWNRSIGGWVDSAYVVGEVYRSRDEYMAPALGKTNYPMEVTRQLVGPAHCNAEDAKFSCVRLIYTSKVSDPQFRDDMARFIEATVGQSVKLNSIEISRRTEVIAHPQTLLPFRTVSTETKTIVLTDPAGKEVVNEDSQEMTAIYSYNESTAAR